MKILYVVGYPRTGSTLFGNVLNEIPGVAHVGEVVHTGAKLSSVKRCGCGVQVDRCPFWERARQRPIGWDDLTEVYRTLFDLTEAEWLVDTSKEPGYLQRLRREVPADRLVVVHLLRDPRASIHSMMRRRRFKNERDQVRQTPLADALRAVRYARQWRTDAATAAASDPAMSVRYEDFAAHPQRVVGDVAEVLSVNAAGVVSEDGVVNLGENHAVAGNRSRLQRGPTRIVLDEAWREEMSRLMQRAVWSMTAGVARREGYERWHESGYAHS